MIATFLNPFGYAELFALAMSYIGDYWTTTYIFYVLAVLFFLASFYLLRINPLTMIKEKFFNLFKKDLKLWNKRLIFAYNKLRMNKSKLYFKSDIPKINEFVEKALENIEFDVPFGVSFETKPEDVVDINTPLFVVDKKK